MSEGVSNKACPKPFPTLPYQPSHIPPRSPFRPSPSPCFFRLFFGLQFFFPKSFPKPFQGASLGPQNHEKPIFFLPKPSQGPSFCPFFGRSVFLSLFGWFFGYFSGKNDTKNDASFHSGAFFFGTADPYDSIVFTIRKLLFRFWPFQRFSLKMLKNPIQKGSPKNHRKNMPAGTQNHPKMLQNPWNLCLKTPTGTKKAMLCRLIFFELFSVPCFRTF